MAVDGSDVLLRAMLDGLDMFGIVPIGRGPKSEEEVELSEDEFQALREALEGVMGTLTPNQVRFISAFMVAHAAFLVGALLNMPAPDPSE